MKYELIYGPVSNTLYLRTDFKLSEPHYLVYAIIGNTLDGRYYTQNSAIGSAQPVILPNVDELP